MSELDKNNPGPDYPDLFMNRFFSSSKDGETTSEVLIIDENNVF